MKVKRKVIVVCSSSMKEKSKVNIKKKITITLPFCRRSCLLFITF